MNGREVLACWEAVEPEMTIEPLRNLPVIRDLVVDRAPFENKVASLEPWLERPDAYPRFPEPLSHKQMKDASKALDCIGCMCCYSACPVIGLGDLTDFAGPAPLVQLGQTALDPRNEPGKGRALAGAHGHFQLRLLLQMRGGLPGRIPIVSRVIEPLKAKAAQLLPEMAGHSRALRAIVAARGPGRSGRVGAARAGLCARWRDLPRIVRLLLRGKINPLKTLLRHQNRGCGARAAVFSVREVSR